MEYLITEGNDNILLSNFIKKNKLFSIGLLYKLLRKKKIMINEKVIKNNVKLFKSQILHIKYLVLNNNKINNRAIDNSHDYSSNIVYENQHLSVINKPYNLPSQQGSSVSKSIQTSIESFCRNRKIEPYFMVHRLDRYTSGLMIIAKYRYYATTLQQLFLHKVIKKKYICIVEGKLCSQRVINIPVFNKHKLQEAKTILKPLCQSDHNTLVLVEILTGRKHQIRKHCSTIGHSIVGDKKYMAQKEKYIYLHSLYLSFYKTNYLARPPKHFIERMVQEFQFSHIDLFMYVLGIS